MNTVQDKERNCYTAPKTDCITIRFEAAVLTASTASSPENYNIDDDEFIW